MSGRPRVPVTWVIPSIFERAHLLPNAVAGIGAQTYEAEGTIVLVDAPQWFEREQCMRNMVAKRNALLGLVRTPWMATFDDDDVPDPDHLEVLWETRLADPSSQLVYGLSPRWWEVPDTCTNPWHASTSQALIDVEAVRAVGGWVYVEGMNEDVAADRYWVAECGLRRLYAPRPTWKWDLGTHNHIGDLFNGADQGVTSVQ